MTAKKVDAKLILRFLAGSVSVNGLVVAGQYLATSPLPFGRAGQIGTTTLLSFSQFAILPILLTILLIPVGLTLLFLASYRRIALAILLVSVFHSATGLASFALSVRIREDAFAALAVRSRPLVEAVHAYQTKYGRAPADPDRLIPEFLSEWPATDMAAYPEYGYILVSDTTLYEGNEWILEVRASNGLMNWDSFLYFPAQNYPKFGYGGVIDRVGDWAYVHE